MALQIFELMHSSYKDGSLKESKKFKDWMMGKGSTLVLKDVLKQFGDINTLDMHNVLSSIDAAIIGEK